MEFKILETEFNGKRFKIEEDYPEVGVYLYVFDEDKCIKDYLQNSIEVCKQIAFRDFGVPMESWSPAI